MNSFTTAFIGAGNMAGSIVGGLLNAGFDASSMRAADPVADNLEAMRQRGLSVVTPDNGEAVTGADVVVLAIKPQVMKQVCIELAPKLRAGQLAISIAAGISATSLNEWLGADVDVVRCMPNTPALLGVGASALYAGADVGDTQRQRATAIMEAVGTVRWVDDEQLMHAVTALSGSGPAYFFQFMEAMIGEAERMGLDPDTARTLCAQTCLGAGRMLAESDVDATELRRRVTSPGGTTERAVASFTASKLDESVERAMRACLERSREMARELA